MVTLRFNLPCSRFRRNGLPVLAASLLLVSAGCSRSEEAPPVGAGADADSTPVSVPEPRITEPPNLEGTPPEVRLVVPPRFEDALAEEGAGFDTLRPNEFGPEILGGAGGWSFPWSERVSPFAVIADFDGDGRRDVAVLQRSPTQGRAAVVLDAESGPRVAELRRWSRAVAGDAGAQSVFYLRLHPAGTMRVPDFGGTGADSTVTLAHEGIEVVAYGQAARTYWYDNGRFTSLTTAD